MLRLCVSTTLITTLLSIWSIGCSALSEYEVKIIGEAISANLKTTAMLEALGHTECGYIFQKSHFTVGAKLTEIRRNAPVDLREHLTDEMLRIADIENQAKIEVRAQIDNLIKALDANTACGMVAGQFIAAQLSTNFKLDKAFIGEYYELPK